MRTIIGTVLAAIVLTGCGKHRDEKAERERDERAMMQKVLESAERDSADGGIATAPSSETDH
jgi:hypothetical protein